MIHANAGANLAEINVIKANKQMETILRGKPKKITELRGGSLLVEVKDEEQRLQIRSIKKLDETDVTTTEHASLNKVKGILRYKNQLRYSNEEILNTLHQVIKRVQGERIPTSISILTFESRILPREVTIG